MTVVDTIDRIFRGRSRGIAVAWLITVVLPMIYALFLPGQVTPSAAIFFGITCVIFIGLPALLGLVCLMVPLHDTLLPYGAGIAAVGVVIANVLLVASLWKLDFIPGEPGALGIYLVFAAVAAGVWLVSDRLFRSSTVA